MQFVTALFQQAFLQNALIGGVLASIACGMIGPIVHVRRLGYIAGGIAHAIFGGIGFAYWAGFPPIYGALASAVLCAGVIAKIGLTDKGSEESAISALWAGGMALGVLFVAATPGYAADLTTFLFGNILLLDNSAIELMMGLIALLLLALTAFHHSWVVLCFDDELAYLRRVPVGWLTFSLYIMIALAVVLLIQIVGMILVIAWLTLPSAMALSWSRSLARMMLLTCSINAVVAVIGLCASYYFDLPAGSVIILIITFLYVLHLTTPAMQRKKRHRQQRQN